MSDVSQGEGWWVASDGRWYPPQDYPNDGAGSPSQVPPQSSTSSHSSDELSTERSAVAVATAQQCVNGHEMPESSIFCSVCGSGHSEVGPDFSAPASDRPQGWMRKRLLAVIVTVVVLAGAGIGLGFSGGSSSSNTPSASAPATAPASTWVTAGTNVGNAVSQVQSDATANSTSTQGACETLQSDVQAAQALGNNPYVSASTNAVLVKAYTDDGEGAALCLQGFQDNNANGEFTQAGGDFNAASALVAEAVSEG